MTAIFDVPGISCGRCRAHIESGLVDVDGVEAVSVDVEAKQVSVTGHATEDAVRGRLTALGYPPE